MVDGGFLDSYASLRSSTHFGAGSNSLVIRGQDGGGRVAGCAHDCACSSCACLWCRDKLTGDWDGNRTCLTEHGITVNAELTHFYQGVASGGVLEFPLNDLLVSGLPDSIPEHIELNIEELEVGKSIRIKDVTPPPGCEFVQDPDLVVLHIVAPKGEVEAPVAEDAPSEPEVISKGKESEEEPEGAGSKE